MTGINLAVTVGVWCRPLIRHARHKAGHDEERGSAFQRHPELPPRISLSLHPGLRITRAAGELFQKNSAPVTFVTHGRPRVSAAAGGAQRRLVFHEARHASRRGARAAAGLRNCVSRAVRGEQRDAADAFAAAGLGAGEERAGGKMLLRHGRACPGHPRLCSCICLKTWMPATSAGMTIQPKTIPL
jgi:hypothetical protein